jgi:hypothetical protein
VHTEFDVEVIGPAREQLDQTGGRVFGEQTLRRHPKQPPSAPSLAHLKNRAVLQSEHLGRPAGQPQTTRSECDADARANEQAIAELFTQLTDVQRNRCLGDLQFDRRQLHRSEADDSGECAQLCRCHAIHPSGRIGLAPEYARYLSAANPVENPPSQPGIGSFSAGIRTLTPGMLTGLPVIDELLAGPGFEAVRSVAEVISDA